MMDLENQYYADKTSRRYRFILLTIASLFFFIISLSYLGIDTAQFIEQANEAPEVLMRMFGIDWGIIPTLFEQTLTTIAIVILSLSASVVLSFTLSFSAAENTAPWKWLAVLIKAVITIIRAIPSLILALIIVSSIGFGNTPAILIMSVVGTAQLSRLFIGSIEDSGTDVIEALKSTGASRIGVILHGVTPVVSTAFLSWLSIQAENTISLSISLGVLGIEGIGLLLSDAQMNYQFTTITTIILYIFIIMFAFEWIMQKLRERITNG